MLWGIFSRFSRIEGWITAAKAMISNRIGAISGGNGAVSGGSEAISGGSGAIPGGSAALVDEIGAIHVRIARPLNPIEAVANINAAVADRRMFASWVRRSAPQSGGLNNRAGLGGVVGLFITISSAMGQSAITYVTDRGTDTEAFVEASPNRLRMTRGFQLGDVSFSDSMSGTVHSTPTNGDFNSSISFVFHHTGDTLEWELQGAATAFGPVGNDGFWSAACGVSDLLNLAICGPATFTLSLQNPTESAVENGATSEFPQALVVFHTIAPTPAFSGVQSPFLVAPGVIRFDHQEGSVTGSLAGGQYQIRVAFSAYAGMQGTNTPPRRTASATFAGTVSLAVSAGPQVSVDTDSARACPRGIASILAEVAVSGTFTYQWQVSDPTAPGGWADVTDGPLILGGSPTCATVSGATQPTLDLALACTSGGGGVDGLMFRCIVSNACGSTTSNPATLTVCEADVNCSGDLTVQDIFDFLAFYFAGDPLGDFNGSGLPATVQDIFDFLAAYFEGCD